jgi:hypothetical protein
MENNQTNTSLRKIHATKDSLQNTFTMNGEANTSIKGENSQVVRVVRGKPYCW